MTHKSIISKANVLKLLLVTTCLLCNIFSISGQTRNSSFPKGKKAYNKFIKKNLVLPDHIEKGDSEGEVKDATIEESLSPACDQEALRFAKNMIDWKPGKRKGKNIDSYYMLSIPFEGTHIMPEFPGGQDDMLKFIGQNLRYPDDAQRGEKEGRVVVRFHVDTEGNIKNAEVMKNIYPSLDKEALRVINSMPRWKPGSVGDKPVEVYFSIPISFRLNGKSRRETHTNVHLDRFGRSKNEGAKNL